jgi:RimJ/RimL family protein N-acetyltransferase
MQKSTKATEDDLDVTLVEGSKTSKEHAFYWHIYSKTKRAGQVYIDLANDPILGDHHSIHIFLNKTSQGQGIGRIGYKEACVRSGLDKIYAHMRKSNLASKRAAEAAGFKEVHHDAFTQLVLVWKK